MASAPRDILNVIGGKPCPPVGEQRWRALTCPLDGTPYGRVCLSSAADVEAAVVAAENCFTSWSQVPIKERCKLLGKLVEVIDRHSEELVCLNVLFFLFFIFFCDFPSIRYNKS